MINETFRRSSFSSIQQQRLFFLVCVCSRLPLRFASGEERIHGALEK
jgi:hypothetical protein